MSDLTVYTTSWCPFSRRLVTDLDRAGIEFDDIDVDEDGEAAALVQSLNNGNRTVPTVVFADGTSLTNPPIALVKARLAG
ncbi:mycoredoxin [Nakamurella panacisegetis]|uniref:Mycoredoxin n=1 Tax=Nakamurella panacisegetis TaxID=1090615 RepID=A0A1H0KHC3_9ACTN|nr:mycoredoxin [Nakamurella panacisegetis]SDO55295.1 mycoredoxin [Nakamurella panacisegetis]